MKMVLIRILLGRVTLKLRRNSAIAAIICSFAFFAVAAQAITLRIVSYNIDCEDQGTDNGITGPTHSLPTVIQGIGLHHIGTNAQQVDIINCEELNSTTLANFVTQLNAIYGAGSYTYDATTDTNTGGGPDGLIYNTHTVQVVSARALRDGRMVLLQSNGTYINAYNPGGGTNAVTRSPMLYQLRPIGAGTTNDFYMYVSHARSSSDNSVGDARYAEAQEVRSDAKYKLAAGSHILYAGDWNLFNGSGENAYKCLTGQITSDGTNWADTNLSLWANTNQTQAFDPTSKTSPPTTTSFSNSTNDPATYTYLYDDSTDSGSFCMTSRLDIQLPNALMFAAYNSKGGVQLAPDTSDPYDTSGFPSSQYPYAFEVFGNNGTTPRLSQVTSSSNHSLDDLATTTPNAVTVYADILLSNSGATNVTGSDHYPIVGDYIIVTNSTTPPPPTASFSGTPTNGAQPLIVTFNDTSTGSITNWSWNFGDGGTTNVVTTNVAHTYTNAGVFSVTEIVTGPGGSSTNTHTNFISVLTPFQAWQLQYFGCTNCPQAQPGADADGTGQNNQFKYIAGLNPTNPASVFVFGVALSTNPPGAPALTFNPAVAGRTYTPLFETDLTASNWQTLTTISTPVTNGSQVTITDTNASQTQKFYRINILFP